MVLVNQRSSRGLCDKKMMGDGMSWIPGPGNAAGPGGGALPQLDEGAFKVLRHRVQPRPQVRADVLGCAAQLRRRKEERKWSYLCSCYVA